jgi:diacylglycerol kinase (ATP)
MANQHHTGWRRLVNATGYSWAGLKAAWRNEEAFRQEGLLCAVLTPLALWLGNGAVEQALLIGSLLLIVIVELLNTGIEVAVDRIGQERHELSGRAKDIGSAAVFMAVLNAAVVWLLILFA